MNNQPNIINAVGGTGLPLPGNDIDTDRIIPARYLRCVTFEKLGDQVFWDERFNQDNTSREHPFDDPRYQGASILIVNRNFGCGSSREHAPQALMRYGIRAIIGESFAEIFAGNCGSLGIPVCTAEATTIKELQYQVEHSPGTLLELDISRQTLRAGEKQHPVQMSASLRTALLAGNWDTLEELLQNTQQIDQVHGRLPYLSF